MLIKERWGMLGGKMRLSQSSISTYLQCPKKYQLHREVEESQITVDMKIGTDIHKLIEDYTTDENFEKEAAKIRLTMDNFTSAKKEKFDTCCKNFLQMGKKYITNNDKIEYPFEVKLNGDVYVGRFDRIVGDTIIDWKTSKVSQIIDDSIQCIVYESAYKKIFGKTPKVVMVSLLTGTAVEFIHTKIADIFFEEVVPHVVRGMKNKDYPRLGLYNNACYLCTYKEECGV